MNLLVELKAGFFFAATIVLWYKFSRYVFPKVKVSAPEAIGRATGFFVVSEIIFSTLVWLVITVIQRNMELQLLVEVIYFIKFVGFLFLAVVGALITLRTSENTHTMNVKIYAVVCFIPNIFISSLSFSSGTLFVASVICVPIASISGGYFFLKKYQNVVNN